MAAAELAGYESGETSQVRLTILLSVKILEKKVMAFTTKTLNGNG
jgi:hypothetical protein